MSAMFGGGNANPLLVGYHVRTAPRSGRVLEQDAFVSSLLFFVTLLSLGLAVSFSHWSTLASQTVYVARHVVECLLVVFMLAAMAFMLKLRFSRRRTVRALYRLAGQDGHEARGLLVKLKEILPLIGLAVFYIPGTLNDFPKILAHIDCMSSFIDCHLQFAYIVGIAFHVTRLLFMGTELLFCIYFKDAILQKNWKTRYGLAVVMAATGTVLFDCILHDSMDIFREDDAMRNECHGDDAFIADNVTLACLKEDTDLYRAADNIDRFVYPLNIEFFIIVLEVIIHLFHTQRYIHQDEVGKITGVIPPRKYLEKLNTGMERMRAHKEDLDRLRANQGEGETDEEERRSNVEAVKEQKRRLAELCDEMANIVRCYHDGDVAQFNETLTTRATRVAPPHTARSESALRRPPSHDDSLGPSVRSYSACRRRRREGHASSTSPAVAYPRPSPHCCSFLVLICLLWSLLYVAIGLLTFSNTSLCFINVYKVYEFLYWIPAVVVCALGCHVSGNLAPKTRAFHGFEVLIVLSAFSTFVWSFFSLIAAIATLAETANDNHQEQQGSDVACLDPSIRIWSLAIGSFIDLFQAYLQTCLMFQTARLRTSDASIHPAGAATATIDKFRSIALIVSLFNITLWIIDSFVVMKNIEHLETVRSSYYGPEAWDLLAHLTIPVALFYRFNSAVFFLEVYLDTYNTED